MQPDSSPAAGETIGQRLKRLRLERGLSQRELAAPGVSYAYISRIEAGSRQPSVKALRRLAAKLNVSADYLETGSDLDPAAARELRLSNLELAVRLGETEGVESSLKDALAESVAAGDHEAARRARVTLAGLALKNDAFPEAVLLLEAATASDAFSAVDQFEIYANLGMAYAGAGRPEQAVELYERCIEDVQDHGGDPSLEARYATLLSYALTDMGETGRAEEVVRRALDRMKDTSDPYMRVRLYWSIARLAHAEGRDAVALTNVRKAIALLQATDDTFHLARAHLLAAAITLGREQADEAESHLEEAEHLLSTSSQPEDVLYITQYRARIALLRKDHVAAARFAREALEVSKEVRPVEEGVALHALADALSMGGDVAGADDAYRQAVDLLEQGGRWRDASTACRSWGRLLREQSRESEAMDVLDRAAEFATRVTPETARAER
jgi:transcriptional regulator with XRE-family HTH domain